MKYCVSVRFTDGVGDVIEGVDGVSTPSATHPFFMLEGLNGTIYLPIDAVKSILVEPEKP